MEALEHVYSVLGIEDDQKLLLLEEGVESIDDLYLTKNDVIEHRLTGVKATTTRKLILFFTWAVKYRDKHKKHPNVLTKFTEEEYRRTRESDHCVDNLLRLVGHNQNVVFDKSMIVDRIRQSREDIKLTIPKELRDLCNFNLDEFIEYSVESILCSPKGPIVAAGRTQAGKSAFKAVMALICYHLDVGLVVLTKGVKESKELHAKLVQYLEETNAHKFLKVPQRGKRNVVEFSIALHNGGAIVIGDTNSQIDFAHSAISLYREKNPRKKFVAIVDECDEMFRTPTRAQKMEQAYDRFMSLAPCLEVYASATPVPLLIHFKREYKEIEHFMLIEPPEDYCAVEDMKLLHKENGRQVTVPMGNVQRFNSSFKNIPYFSREQQMLIEDCLNKKNCTAKLYLDISNPRVFAEGNVYQKAKGIQDNYPDVIAVAVTGSSIKYIDAREEGRWIDTDKDSLVGDVLNYIDNKYGLDRPVFVFGYRKMQRGISFRSDFRVPTHILMALGVGYSVEAMLQALGRATFNGKGLLERNGHDHVTVLTNDRDWDSAKSYHVFLQEIRQRVNQGTPLLEVIWGTDCPLPHQSNFMHGQNRKIGKHKSFKEDFDLVAFEEEPMNKKKTRTVDVLVKHKHSENEFAQKLLKALKTLCDKDKSELSSRHCYETEDIHEAYCDEHDEFVTQKEIDHQLTQFKNDGIIDHKAEGSFGCHDKKRRKATKKGRMYRWHVSHPARLDWFMTTETNS